VQNFLITLTVISAPSVLSTWKNLCLCLWNLSTMSVSEWVSEWGRVLIAGRIKKTSHNVPQCSQTEMPQVMWWTPPMCTEPMDAVTLIVVRRKRLQEQCKLVLEENELLMEQLDVQQRKHDEQRKMHIQEGLQFTAVLASCFFFYFVSCYLLVSSLPKLNVKQLGM